MQEMTVGSLIREGERLFEASNLYYGHGTACAYDEALYIVLSVMHCLPPVDNSVFDRIVDEPAHECIQTLFARRVNEKVPAAYLLGEAWFAGLPFFVDKNVLVPRSPFAELIYEGFAPWVDEVQTKSILDLCTGSGCIGIACAMQFTRAQVDISDVSKAALRVADKNISRHGLGSRVQVVESNLYTNLKGKRYDLIVSNPPYVGEAELLSLPEEYKKEPTLGLDGGQSGLDLVHTILAFADDHLTKLGVLFMEVGNTADALQACYPTVEFLWQEFERGGDGVFMLTKKQLQQYKPLFMLNVIK